MSQKNHRCDEQSDKCLTGVLQDLARREGAEKVASSYNSNDAYALRIRKLYVRFIRMAIAITLTFGTFWGVSILTKAAGNKGFSAPDPAAVQAHAHAQVFGWIGLFIMGVAYMIYPRMKQVRLRCLGAVEASFWLMSGGIILRAIAQPFAHQELFGVAVVVSALCEIAAAVIFVRSIFYAFLDSSDRGHVSDAFILSAMLWLCVALAINLGSMIEIARTGNAVIPDGINNSRIRAEVFGFIISMILGVGARLLPKLGPYEVVNRKVGFIAAGLYGLGVAAKVMDASQAVGSALIVAAVISNVISVGIFRKQQSAMPFPSLQSWLRISWFWLVVGGAMMLAGDVYAAITSGEAPRVWIGAYRHAVTVGFVTTMLVGMALNTVPRFFGAPLYSWRLVKIAFWLLVIGNTARVVFQALTLTGNPVAYAIAGLSGYLELTALACFGANIILTFMRPRTIVAAIDVAPPQAKREVMLS